MIPILSGNVASALPTGYEVANSCRFNDDDSAYMHFTPSSAGNRRTMTLSVWFKGTSLADGTNNILGQYNSSNENNSMLLTIESNGRIMVWNYTTSAYTMNLRTNRLLRDPSAWYHVVVAVDTTQSTDTDRVKIYVNGVQETSFFASTYPTQNLELFMNEDKAQNIGTQRFGSTVSSPFDGYMAEFCFIDGQQLAPTSFGEFDDDSPRIWKPKDFKDDVTFGSNGYYLDFEDSSALGNDISGNNNDFTTVNFAATDQATDTCTNNFCTFNPLVPQDHTFSEGNLKYSSGSGWESGIVTIEFSAGEFYMEQKINPFVVGVKGAINKYIFGGFPATLIFDALGAMNIEPGYSDQTKAAQYMGLAKEGETQDIYGINTQSMFGDYDEYNVDRVDELEAALEKARGKYDTEQEYLDMTTYLRKELKDRKKYVDRSGAGGDIQPDATDIDIAADSFLGDGAVAEDAQDLNLMDVKDDMAGVETGDASVAEEIAAADRAAKEAAQRAEDEARARAREEARVASIRAQSAGSQGDGQSGSGAVTTGAGRNPWGRAKGGLIRKQYGSGGIVSLKNAKK